MLAVAGLALTTCANSAKVEGEKAITGEGACAKCILKEGKQCQIIISAEEGGKKTTYYVAQNDVSKAFGNQACHARKKVTATGTVKSVDGKLELTPSKIEMAKE